jgi:dihydropteroate synthase
MQQMTRYDDVVEDVRSYFEDFSVKAASYGIKEWVLDPGIGFAKTNEQNYEILRRLAEFKELETSAGFCPQVLVGVSRKSLIYKYFNISPEESLPATQVLHLAALQNGADILRVHDVSEASRTLSLYRMLVK